MYQARDITINSGVIMKLIIKKLAWPFPSLGLSRYIFSQEFLSIDYRSGLAHAYLPASHVRKTRALNYSSRLLVTLISFHDA